MSIIIRRDAAALPAMARHNGGFTLPELLVSLCILLLLMQGVWQWNAVLRQGIARVEQNQQAVYLAQCCLNKIQPDLADGWSVAVEREPVNDILQQTTVIVSYQNQRWPFCYVGKLPEKAQEQKNDKAS